MNYHYLWWIPVVTFYYSVYAWISNKASADTVSWKTSKWFWALVFLGVFGQWWAIVAKVSKNLAFDALVYDFVMIGGFYIAMFATSQTLRETFTWIHYLGMGFCFLGLVLLKVK